MEHNENSEIDSLIYHQLILDICGNAIWWGKENQFNKWC